MPAKKKIEVLPDRVIIVVTNTDIRDGEVGACGRCPVALALRRRFPDAVAVSVGGSRSYVDQCYRLRRHRGYFDLSEKVTDFISTFDLTGDAKPVRFTLRLVWNRIA